jgi:hypothetical protein
MPLLSQFGGRLGSKDVKILQPAFDRFRHLADEAGHPLPGTPCKAHQRAKMHDKRIAFVFQVELEPLGREYGRTSRWPAIPSCKRHCGVLEQENSADLPVRIAGHPKAFLVAADEERRDRVADDTEIERLKLRNDLRSCIGRLARRAPRKIWAH